MRDVGEVEMVAVLEMLVLAARSNSSRLCALQMDLLVLLA